MAKRNRTKYAGVYFTEAPAPDGTTERLYIIRYYRGDRQLEDAVGGAKSDRMDALKASRIRMRRISGIELSNEEKRQKAKAAKDAESSKWTIDKLWAAYCDTKALNKALRSDKGRYDAYLKNHLGKKEPSELMPLDIERVKKTMKKKNLSDQSIKHALGILKRICNYGFNSQLSPALSFKIQMPIVSNEVTEDLSDQQLKALHTALDAHENQLVANVVRLALATGMRRSEMLSLRWDDVDFSREWIFIRNPKSGRDQKIPMNQAARGVLEKIKTIPTGSDFVFPGRGAAGRVDVSKELRAIRKKAGLPKSFRMLHGIRHFFASSLAASGQVQAYELQRLLTHATPRMTQRYMHLRDEGLKRASEVATANLLTTAGTTAQRAEGGAE